MDLHELKKIAQERIDSFALTEVSTPGTGIGISTGDCARVAAACDVYNEAFSPAVVIDLIQRLEKHEEEKEERETVSFEMGEYTMQDGRVLPARTEYMYDVILARLLDDGVMFVNSRNYVEGSWDDISDGKWNGRTGKISDTATIVAFVGCNDIFAWGCADSENISTKELLDLWKLHEDPDLKGWGSAIWCMKKRNEQPQPPVKRDMIAAGVWSSDLDALNRNSSEISYDKFVADKAAKDGV